MDDNIESQDQLKGIEMVQESGVVLVECSCRRDQPYVDGSLPRFHDDPKKALFDYVKNLVKRPMYWGVHLHGLHMVGGKKKLLP